MTYYNNGTLQSAIFKENMNLGANLYDISQVYTREFDMNLLNPIDGSQFAYPSPPQSLYYSEYANNSLIGYAALNNIYSWIENMPSMYGNISTRVINASIYNWDPMSEQWSASDINQAVGAVNDFSGNMHVATDFPCNFFYRNGTTGADLNDTYYGIYSAYVGLNVSYVTNNSCELINASSGEFIYIQVNSMGQLANMTMNVTAYTSGSVFSYILAGNLLTNTTFDVTPSTGLIYAVKDSSLDYAGYFNYTSLVSFLDPDTQCFLAVNASIYTWNTSTIQWDLNVTTTPIGGAFDAGMVGVYSNGPNMIYPIGTTGQMLNDTYGSLLSMMVGMDEFTVTANSTLMQNSVNGQFAYFELFPNGYVENFTYSMDMGMGLQNASYIFVTPPNPSTLSKGETTSINGIVHLTWTAVSGVNNYSIYRSPNPITNTNGITPLFTTNGLSYNDTGLGVGQYNYVVIAHVPENYNFSFNLLSNDVNIAVSFLQTRLC